MGSHTPLLLRLFPPTPLLPGSTASPEVEPEQVPVVLLHGTIDSPGAWSALAAELHRRGRRVLIPGYGNRGSAPIGESLVWLEGYLAEVHASGASLIDVIAHSQGGLLAYLLARRGAALRHVVSISDSVAGVSVPWWASPLAWGGGRLARALAGPALAEQLHPRIDRWLAATPLPPWQGRPVTVTRWVSLTSAADSWVRGATARAYPGITGAEQVDLDEVLGRVVAHWRQQSDPAVLALAADLVGRAHPEP